jgi:hypothetical protein
VVVEMYAVTAKVISVMWVVDVKEMGIIRVARMIVVTKVLLNALISESKSERGTGRRERIVKVVTENLASTLYCPQSAISV